MFTGGSRTISYIGLEKATPPKHLLNSTFAKVLPTLCLHSSNNEKNIHNVVDTAAWSNDDTK
jgi:hypothetical protein